MAGLARIGDTHPHQNGDGHTRCMCCGLIDICVSESGTGFLLTDAEFDAWETLLISSGVRMRGSLWSV